MADRAGSGLLCGHFGQAIYEPRVKKWHFERSLSQGNAIQAIRNPRVVSEASIVRGRPYSNAQSKYAPSKRREKQTKSLAHAYPELQPASVLLPELARISEAIEDAAAEHDAAKDNLLAFGTVPDELLGSSADVAAFPTGSTGGDLRVVQVQKQRQGWSDSNDTWLEVPMIYGQEATWSGPGVPIQQVVFAQPVEHGEAFLAVRYMMRTLIFEITLGKRLIRGSRLIVTPLVEIEINEIGDLSHADTTFNPWNTRQIAIVCPNGRWSVWELDGRLANRVKRVYHGHLVEIQRKKREKILDDGWARITWIGNSATLAVANRRKLTLFKIVNGASAGVQQVDVGLKHEIGYILDLALLPMHPNYLCLLTSNKFFIFIARNIEDEDVMLNKVLSVTHLFNAQDTGLRLHMFADRNDVVFLLQASINPVTVSWRVDFSKPNHLTVTDPLELLLPSTNPAKIRDPISGIYISLVEFGQNLHSVNENNLASRYQSHDVRFYYIAVLSKFLGLVESLHIKTDPEVGMQFIQPPSWDSRPTRSSTPSLDENFIDDDGNDRISSADIISIEPVPSYIQRLKHQVVSKTVQNSTGDFTLTVAQLFSVDISEVTEIDKILEEIRELLHKDVFEEETTATRTLQDLCCGEVMIRDIGEASTHLRDLYSVVPTSQPQEHEQVRHFTLKMMDELASIDIPLYKSFSAVYRELERSWINPVPADTPELVRSAKEQLARSMAADVTLATHMLSVAEPNAEQQPQSQQSQDMDWDLPLRPTGSSSVPTSSRATTPSTYFDASSQTRPTSSAAPSTTSVSSNLSSFSAPEIARLSRYCSFSKQAPFALPRALRRVLLHWTPGEDPKKYDWLSTARRLRHGEEEGSDAYDDEMTEKERQRMQQRKDRYVRRQRREAEESQRVQMRRSQAPEIISSSQPPVIPQSHLLDVIEGRQAGGMLVANSSQSLGANQLPSSQVLPGRHGGKTPGKRKRKSGF